VRATNDEVRRFLESALYQDYLDECDSWKEDVTNLLTVKLKEGKTSEATALAGALESISEFKTRMFNLLLMETEEKGKESEDAE